MTAWKWLLLIISIPLLGLGCSQKTDNQSSGFLGNTLGETFNKIDGPKSKIGNFIGNAGTNFIRGLNDEKKAIIDEWLAINKLNPFGDPIDTAYASGAPIFDQQTGEAQDRYEYLFEKFPELKKVVIQKLEIEAKEISEE